MLMEAFPVLRVLQSRKLDRVVELWKILEIAFKYNFFLFFFLTNKEVKWMQCPIIVLKELITYIGLQVKKQNTRKTCSYAKLCKNVKLVYHSSKIGILNLTLLFTSCVIFSNLLNPLKTSVSSSIKTISCRGLFW